MKRYGFDETSGRWVDLYNSGGTDDRDDYEQTWAERVLVDGAGLCGCQDLDPVLPLVASYLRGEWGTYEETIIHFDSTDPAQILVAGLADVVGLTNHGGNVGGSWVEPAGERWLVLYKRDHESMKEAE